MVKSVVIFKSCLNIETKTFIMESTTKRETAE